MAVKKFEKKKKCFHETTGHHFRDKWSSDCWGHCKATNLLSWSMTTIEEKYMWSTVTWNEGAAWPLQWRKKMRMWSRQFADGTVWKSRGSATLIHVSVLLKNLTKGSIVLLRARGWTRHLGIQKLSIACGQMNWYLSQKKEIWDLAIVNMELISCNSLTFYEESEAQWALLMVHRHSGLRALLPDEGNETQKLESEKTILSPSLGLGSWFMG